MANPGVLITPATDEMAVCHRCGKELNIKSTGQPTLCLDCKKQERI